MLFNREVTSITKEDLQDLIDQAVPEDNHLDYKVELPDKSRDQKIKFLTDVVAFANSSGGLLLFGVDEVRDAKGKPTGIPSDPLGIVVNTDQQFRRLQQMIENGVDQRIVGITYHPIPIDENAGKFVLAVKIPRSWNGPHAVASDGHWRFYARGHAMNYPLDVSQIRNLFNLSENLTQQIKDFRASRRTLIMGNDTLVRLLKRPKVIVHVVPVEAFVPGRTIDWKSQNHIVDILGFFGNHPSNQHRYNLDGKLMYLAGEGSYAMFYVQVYRNGIVEAVDAAYFTPADSNRPAHFEISPLAVGLQRTVERYLLGLKRLLFVPPIVVSISIVDAYDYRPVFSEGPFFEAKPIDRKAVQLPELLVQDYDTPSEVILRPAFDALWNAIGLPNCNLYDEEGKWTPKK